MINLDTHVVVWLYQGDLDPFPKKLWNFLNVRNSPFRQLLIWNSCFLHAIRRFKVASHEIIDDVRARIGLSVLQDSFEGVVRSSAALNWTRDPIDRLIPGHASFGGRALLTKDRIIRKHHEKALW